MEGTKEMKQWVKIKDLEGDTYIVNIDNISYLFETEDTVKVYMVDGMAIKANKKEAEDLLNESKSQKTSHGC